MSENPYNWTSKVDSRSTQEIINDLKNEPNKAFYVFASLASIALAAYALNSTVLHEKPEVLRDKDEIESNLVITAREVNQTIGVISMLGAMVAAGATLKRQFKNEPLIKQLEEQQPQNQR